MSAPSIARLHISPSQRALAAIALLLLVALGISTVRASNETVKASTVLSDIETPAATIIFTQRETLVYATRLAQWSNGGTTRRSVQIARNLLAQRLSVIDSSGKSMGERANAQYWQALKAADAIVAAEPAGTLPESSHTRVNALISPVIDQILATARELVVSYQKSVDAQMREDAQSAAVLNRLNLTLFYLFIAVGGVFLFWSGRTNFRSLRRARREIEQERNKLEETIAELEDLNVAKSQFISTVNHELRTPLTSIIGYVEVIREDSLIKNAPHIDNYLEVVDRNAQILSGLVESALALSKVDSSQRAIDFKRINLEEVIDHTLFVLRPASEKKSITIAIERIEGIDYSVAGDAGLLNQVLLNLVANAIKFSPEGSTITLTLKLDGDISLSVRDHGIGIPADELGSLFTRFFRAKNAVDGHFQGSGLGLAIASQVLELHGGTIEVDSQLGLGSTFTITLPAYPSAEAELIASRRVDVLQRSLARLQAANQTNLKALTHEIGGAIGFYGFTDLAPRILDFSRALPVQDSYSNELASQVYQEILRDCASELQRVQKL